MIRRQVSVIILVLAALTMLVGTAFSAPIRIGSISEHLREPVRVAIDGKGKVYVTEASRNALKVYDSRGKLLRTVAVPRPMGVAVGPSGEVYVGAETKKSIEVYSADLSSSRRFTTDEISRPASLAVDGNGRVYVTDTLSDQIRVYDSAGASAFNFGSTGSGNGQFIRPKGVAVNDAVGEIYVSDRPIIQPRGSGPINGARIQVFNKNGVFLRSYGQYGVNVGQICDPGGIAVHDKTGNLFVADSCQGAVHILNATTGASLGALYDMVRPLVNPMGVALGKNDVAYVTSYGVDSVDVYGLDGYVTMDTTPVSLSFFARQLGAAAAAQGISVLNSGSGILNWTASKDASWITLDKTVGSTSPAASGLSGASAIAVRVNASALVPGSYNGSVTVTADFGQVNTIPVSLTVLPPPSITLSNGWLTYFAKKNKPVAAQSVGVTIANAEALTWSASSSSPSWLAISPARGTVTGNAVIPTSVSVNTTGLAVGTHTGVITFSAPGAIGHNSSITVTLTITPSTRISVTTNIAGASYTIAGPAAYSGSGTSWSVEDVPAGDYTITYNQAAGYRRPLPQTKVMVTDGEIAFAGAYASWQELALRKTIVAAKGGHSTNNGEVKTYKTDGAPVGTGFIALDTKYGASVAVGDIDGDGIAELIVGAGPGPENTALVRVYRADGTKMLEFTPFAALYGVNVAAADFDADGKAELVVSPAGGDINPGNVRIYTYNASAGEFQKTGVDILAHGYVFGANIGAADTEGDQSPELLTAPGSGGGNPSTVTIWKIDTVGGMGNWTAAKINDIPGAGKNGATVAGGDVDGDGKDEIIIGVGKEPGINNSLVRIFKADGTAVAQITASLDNHGASVAAVDIDGDGLVEIVAGVREVKAADGKKDGKDKNIGDNDKNDVVIKVYGPTGVFKFAIIPFEDAKASANVAVGDMGL